jgi:hypothetical protein
MTEGARRCNLSWGFGRYLQSFGGFTCRSGHPAGRDLLGERHDVDDYLISGQSCHAVAIGCMKKASRVPTGEAFLAQI